MTKSTTNIKTTNAVEPAGIRTLGEAELDAVAGGTGPVRGKNFYHSPSFVADYALYPRALMA